VPSKGHKQVIQQIKKAVYRAPVFYSEKPDSTCRLLILRRLGGVGDYLMITPLLRQIRVDYSMVDITYGVDLQAFPLLFDLPFVNQVVDYRTLDLKNHNYHYVVDLTTCCIAYENNQMPVMNRIDLFARALGCYNLVDKRPYWKVTEEDRNWALEFLGRGRPLVGLHTASMDLQRNWPAAKYKELIELLGADGRARVVVFDHNGILDSELKSRVLDPGDINIRQLAALIEQLDVYMGPDSGPMHIAAALDIKSVVVFGSVPVQSRLIYYPNAVGVTVEDLSCLGCWYKSCRISYKCMTSLKASSVFNEIIKKIDAV